MYEWAKAGLPSERVEQVSVEILTQRITGSSKVMLLDVRANREFMAGHINGAINIPFPDLRKRYGELDSTAPVLVICNTGHRSSIGTSILKRNGFREVSNVAGGMTGYNAAGLGPECPACIAPHLPIVYKGK
jgi:rhodanese-related sulfurtransferase